MTAALNEEESLAQLAEQGAARYLEPLDHCGLYLADDALNDSARCKEIKARLLHLNAI